MSSTRSFKNPGIFADSATTVIPPTPIAGVAYRDAVAGADDTPNGWRYGTRVASQDWNQVMFLLTSMMGMIDSQGVLGWSDQVEYAVPALAFGSDGLPYIALQASGPSTAAQDPTVATSYWEQFGSGGMVELTTTQSWTVPMAMQLGYIKPKVSVYGGGGGGGRSGTSGLGSGGGGGGGISRAVVDLSGVASVSIVIGNGGAGSVVVGGAGATGGTSSFGSLVSAGGGAGGLGNSTTENLPGSGGIGTIGTLITSYGPGTTSTGSTGGHGGGPGGRALQGAIPGVDGIAPGGGGSGANFGQNGGNGFRGTVIIEW